MIRNYLRLSRPINALAGCLAVFLSGYVAGPASWFPVSMAAVTVLMITASTNAWNDYIDLEIDRVNKPERPLPAGKISPRGALVFFIAGTVFSLLTAIFINQKAFVIALLSIILLYVYSWKLKCSILWGNIIVATIIALCFIFGGVAAGKIQPTIMIAVPAFFVTVGREILKTMADYRGDSEHECRTIAVAWGKPVARTFMLVFLALSGILMLAAYFSGPYQPFYLYITILIVYPLGGYAAITSKADSSPKTLEFNSTLLKYSLFIWVVNIALSAGPGH